MQDILLNCMLLPNQLSLPPATAPAIYIYMYYTVYSLHIERKKNSERTSQNETHKPKKLGGLKLDMKLSSKFGASYHYTCMHLSLSFYSGRLAWLVRQSGGGVGGAVVSLVGMAILVLRWWRCRRRRRSMSRSSSSNSSRNISPIWQE